MAKNDEIVYEEITPTKDQLEEQSGENVVELREELERVWDELDPLDVARLPLLQAEKRLRNKIAKLTTQSIEKNRR